VHLLDDVGGGSVARKERGFPREEEKMEEKIEEREAGVKNEGVASLQKALAEEKEKAEKYLANWQRAQADFVNFKRRTEQERAELNNFANSTLVLNLLPVLDDLERALEHANEDVEGSAWVDGIKLIYKKLKTTLEAQGLEEIEAEGEDFDPNVHEAVMAVEGEEGKVIEETQKGYKMRNRVIRPTKVKVGKGSPSI
jgi:molecular chaperone GrpE